MKLLKGREIIERRAEFANKVTIKVYKRVTTGPNNSRAIVRVTEHSERSPYWYRWETGLMRELINVLLVEDIYEFFFKEGICGFKSRSLDQVKELADTIREE